MIVAKYRILSIDGGGVRGLLVTVLLQQLDKRLPGWRDRVDLLAGTSTGGIIALGLAKGLTPTDLRILYYDKSPRIFGDSLLDNIRDLGRVVGAEFSNRNLRQELEAVFGATKLQNLGKRVLISSFDLDNEDPDPAKRTWKPKFFHNFPGTDTDGSLRAVDVALYTSAAPTYFPSVDGYVDGGVAANNPSMAALAQSLDRRSQIPQRPSIDEITLAVDRDRTIAVEDHRQAPRLGLRPVGQAASAPHVRCRVRNSRLPMPADPRRPLPPDRLHLPAGPGDRPRRTHCPGSLGQDRRTGDDGRPRPGSALASQELDVGDARRWSRSIQASLIRSGAVATFGDGCGSAG